MCSTKNNISEQSLKVLADVLGFEIWRGVKSAFLQANPCRHESNVADWVHNNNLTNSKKARLHT